MRVLALDTTTRAGSIALVEDGEIVAERPGDVSRTHGERLPGELVDLAADRGWTMASVDLFAVAVGPGSFTGLRIGIATIQGLAFVLERSVVGVSALDALGHLGSRGRPVGSLVGAWVDAQRGEVFSALYRIGPAPLFSEERLTQVEGPSVALPAATLAAWHRFGESVLFIGDGAVRYTDAITEDPRAIVAPTPLLAGVIGLIAHVRAALGPTMSPSGVHPLYIRRSDAELDRERQAAVKDDRPRAADGKASRA